MKENFNLSVMGEKVHLVPYRKKFVPRYHQWMQDDYILQMTASEPLTIEEEYEMQQSWKNDKMKCTFIVLESQLNSNELSRMVGDVNLFLSLSHEDDTIVSEIDIMIAEESSRRRGFGREAVLLMMWYGYVHLGVTRFFAKINKENLSSIRLFESLGYEFKNYVEVFQEFEYVFEAHSNENHRKELENVGGKLKLRDYLEEDL